MHQALRRVGAAAVALAVLAGAAGCTTDRDPGATDGSDTLRVLAGSEVKDMVPILEDAAKQVGVKVELTYSGTLSATEQVASGATTGTYDALWFPNNRYLSLSDKAQQALSTSTKIMNSPVVLGLKPDVAKRLGWDVEQPTWEQIAQAAAAGKFTYAMTNPAASNSGFSTLVSVATGLSGTGSALTQDDIVRVTPGMKEFFGGQKLTAGSSGWLADTFTSKPDSADGMFNYESVLMGLDVDGQPLTVVIPKDGVVSSDYPLTLLNSAAAKRDQFTKLTTWLLGQDVQQRIMDDTHRRPGTPGLTLGPEFSTATLFETPFPNTLDVADTLISTYQETARKPSQTVYALDVSGSMDGERIAALKQALKNLAGADTSTMGLFNRFHSREKVSLIPFSRTPRPSWTIEIPAGEGQDAALEQIRDEADGLQPDGSTAIYQALEDAYALAVAQRKSDPDTFVSVVLMTDGENNRPPEYEEFRSSYRSLGADAEGIPTFVIAFGEADQDEMQQVADLTGGQVFTASESGLASAFQEIRGYQ